MIAIEFIVAFGLPHIGGLLGGLIARKSLDTWYKDLKKAPWNPPNYAFGPVWLMLYSAMGIASYMVWSTGNGFSGAAALPLAVYAIQLIINWAFSPIFFGYRSVKWGLVDIILLDIGAAVCAVLFSQVSPMAGLLFIPYLLWLCLATTLSIYVYTHNSHEKHKKPHSDHKEHKK